jgi:hypothetical protein
MAILVKQLMTDFNLFLSHLLSQSGNNTVLLVEETGGPGENHRHVASH